MEYSIQELSRLSGVTTRTLRWYDQIGLLKPSRVAESGYRYYGGAEVDRLQDILYYRALGVELARIKECLDDPSFDRLAALQSHLAALEAERDATRSGLAELEDLKASMAGDRDQSLALMAGYQEKNEGFTREIGEQDGALAALRAQQQLGRAQKPAYAVRLHQGAPLALGGEGDGPRRGPGLPCPAEPVQQGPAGGVVPGVPCPEKGAQQSFRLGAGAAAQGNQLPCLQGLFGQGTRFVQT